MTHSSIKKLRIYFSVGLLLFTTVTLKAQQTNIKASIQLKSPGNKAIQHPLDIRVDNNQLIFQGNTNLPVKITGKTQLKKQGTLYTITIKALEDVYFNYKQSLTTESFSHQDCQFLLPGFWYRRNLRSPVKAPSFHTSDSWLVKEDRLSSPLTAIFNEKSGEFVTVLRSDKIQKAAYSPLPEGEVILSGKSDVGFTGFENLEGQAAISFGYPYREAPKSYTRKLKLTPGITSFSKLSKGEEKTISWIYFNGKAKDYSDFVSQVWKYSFDVLQPKPVKMDYDFDKVKEVLSNFYKESYTATNDLNYYSGVHLLTNDGKSNGVAEVGFLGRVLLNAYFALKYAEQTNEQQMRENARSIFDSYLKKGFSSNGFFREHVKYNQKKQSKVFSIRRQSEGVYAILLYLEYEKSKGRQHQEWEKRMVTLLGKLKALQNPNGSFPRKFDNDSKIIDESGGSTPSATVPLVMASKYFKNKKYLTAAKKTAIYLEKEIISKADYFSSTLDANCEDKEASLYAATAMYYLSLATKGKERNLYRDLAKKATYFTLSWYYSWDVPFAQGQMLGDLGLKTRGWGNVSVENNHIDVFIFQMVEVLLWLNKTTDEPRFGAFAQVIKTSMMQLLPFKGHMCGIKRVGYYPEVVQHTNWDYGKNGKGFYNIHFAPGWTVASLWELLNEGSAKKFMVE